MRHSTLPRTELKEPRRQEDIAVSRHHSFALNRGSGQAFSCYCALGAVCGQGVRLLSLIIPDIQNMGDINVY